MPTGADGFSPSQRLMGRNFTIPGIYLEKSALPTLVKLAEEQDPSNRSLTAHGLMALLRAERDSVVSTRKLAKAISHKVCTDERQTLHFGDWVYVYRQDKNHIKGKWVGPARVVGGHSRLVLVELAGKIYRTSAQLFCHVSVAKGQIGALEGDTLGQPQASDVGIPLGYNLALSPDVKLPPTLTSDDALPAEWQGWEDATDQAGPVEKKPSEADGGHNSVSQQASEPDVASPQGEPEESKEERMALVPSADAYAEKGGDVEGKPHSATTQLFGPVSEWAKYTAKGPTVSNRLCNEGAWMSAKVKKLTALYKYGSVEKVSRAYAPEGARVLDTLWVNTLKIDPVAGNADPTEYHLGDFYRAKSRLTVRGDQEDVTDAPVASPTANKAVLRGWPLPWCPS